METDRVEGEPGDTVGENPGISAECLSCCFDVAE